MTKLKFNRSLQFKQKLKPSTPVEVIEPEQEEEKSAKLFPILNPVTGEVEYHNEETGEKVDTKLHAEEALEPFNKEKFDLFLNLISSGKDLKSSLKLAKISYSSYLLWKRENTTLNILVQEARDNRADVVHEQFFVDEIVPISKKSVANMSHTDMSLEERKLKLISKKQSILSVHKKEEAPTRYGVNFKKEEVQQSQAFSLNLAIPDKLSQSLIDTFTPKQGSDGTLRLDGGDDKINNKHKELKAELDGIKEGSLNTMKKRSKVHHQEIKNHE